MSKYQKFARQRVSQNPDQGLEVTQEGKLLCAPCNQEIDAEKSSTVANHIKSNKHKKSLVASKGTCSIAESFKSDTWEDMVEAFLGVGVPLKIFRNEKLRSWFTKNLKSGSKLPSETSLRRLVKIQATKDEQETIQWLKDQDIIIVADETTDPLNRKVLHILMSPAKEGGHFRLAVTKILDSVCDSSVVSNAIIDATRSHFVSNDRVVCLKSDNAAYMIAAGKALKVVFPRMIHSTCWSHITHLTGEELRIKFENADSYVAAFKAALVRTPSRRQDLVECFRTHNLPAKLPPVPVLTRWATWIEAASFHFHHFDAEIEWIRGRPANESAAIAKLKKLAQITGLKEELQKIAQICPTITATLKKLEANGLPSCDVWVLLRTLEEALEVVFGIQASKLTLYMKTKHPAREFWEQCQYFDPRKASSIATGSTEVIPNAVKFLDTQGVGPEEICTYKILRQSQDYGPEFEVRKFWQTFSREMPKLSDVAQRCLSIPSSSAEVERSFSALKRLLTPLRSSFTEENLAAHMKIMYNKDVTLEKDCLQDSEESDEEI